MSVTVTVVVGVGPLHDYYYFIFVSGKLYIRKVVLHQEVLNWSRLHIIKQQKIFR